MSLAALVLVSDLFRSTIAMIALFCEVDTFEARTALLRAIYNVDGQLPDTITNAAESEHISIAVNLRRMLPLAALLAADSSRSVEEAKGILDTTPILRQALASIRG